ncbi:MAG: folate family ECF transporter S component [Erysipelotrichaceae bacterium]|nr:folate family ECF transporter S component [Erysipelotrichaceae bacterium]
MFKESLKELRSTRNLVAMAMLCALNVVTSWFSIPLSPTLKISFSYLSMSMIGHLFGPSCGIICGFILDTVKFVIKPSGPYNPLWALVEMGAGLLYGVLLYKKKPTVKRCFITKFIVSLVMNVLITSALMAFLYTKGFIFYASSRTLKNLILWPIESTVMYLILTRVAVLFKRDPQPESKD